MELIHKFLPSDSGGILSSCTVVLPPSQSSSGELVSSQMDLVTVPMLKWLEFSLDNTQPVLVFVITIIWTGRKWAMEQDGLGR
jgi:hypothetical protein